MPSILWRPQPKQHLMISCPAPDLFFGGSRGGGKSDALLADWLEHQHKYAEHARGLLVRRTYPELEELSLRCQDIFPASGAHYHVQSRTWRWRGGAFLRLRHFMRPTDADHYQGHSYTWIGIDELQQWPSLAPLDKLRACLRSPNGVPCYFRATGNPGGPGHNLVKARYIDPAPPMRSFVHEVSYRGETTRIERIFIPSLLDDNPILMHNDPTYWARVVDSASGREDLIKAWRWGIWDIVAGGMLDDLWEPKVHVQAPFPIPPAWPITRAFDWGSSKPYSVGWWAESDGATPGGDDRLYPVGTLFLVMEQYGWNGKPNEGLRLTDAEMARAILAQEQASPYAGRVTAGPADSSIFDVMNGESIAQRHQAAGLVWDPSVKGPGSRRQGWQALRGRLKAAREWPMEEPGLFVFDHCRQWIRTVPVLTRSQANPDDVDTETEDHMGDMTRYRIMTPGRRTTARITVQGH